MTSCSFSRGDAGKSDNEELRQQDKCSAPDVHPAGEVRHEHQNLVLEAMARLWGYRDWDSMSRMTQQWTVALPPVLSPFPARLMLEDASPEAVEAQADVIMEWMKAGATLTVHRYFGCWLCTWTNDVPDWECVYYRTDEPNRFKYEPIQAVRILHKVVGFLKGRMDIFVPDRLPKFTHHANAELVVPVERSSDKALNGEPPIRSDAIEWLRMAIHRIGVPEDMGDVRRKRGFMVRLAYVESTPACAGCGGGKELAFIDLCNSCHRSFHLQAH